jgi:hypothetical protein
MPLTNKERQARWRKRMRSRGVRQFTLPWRNTDQPELRALSDFLIRNPDCSFVPFYRDARGRLYMLTENRG